MRSILVLVNSTRNSANAALYAADLALAVSANIHLINVCTLPINVSETPMPESVYEELKDGCNELLDALSADIGTRTKGKIKNTKQVMTDNVDYQIEQYCAANNPFLVVMGATGNSVQNILEGSHALRSLRRLRYPLLIIPEHTRFQPVRNIVLACDTEDIVSGMLPVIPFLKELSELLGARLEVVRVLTEREEPASGDIRDYNVWKNAVGALAPELHFIRRPTVLEGVNAYLEDHRADWLMVFPKTHSALEFHRSRAKQIVLHCAVPVLSVHE